MRRTPPRLLTPKGADRKALLDHLWTSLILPELPAIRQIAEQSFRVCPVPCVQDVDDLVNGALAELAVYLSNPRTNLSRMNPSLIRRKASFIVRDFLRHNSRAGWYSITGYRQGFGVTSLTERQQEALISPPQHDSGLDDLNTILEGLGLFGFERRLAGLMADGLSDRDIARKTRQSMQRCSDLRRRLRRVLGEFADGAGRAP